MSERKAAREVDKKIKGLKDRKEGSVISFE
jgi:hypothetical protein